MASPPHPALTPSACALCRKFITTHYKALKAANPELPVLLRECAGTEARLTARFGAFGAAAHTSSACRLPPSRLRADTHAAHPLQTKAARLASP